MPDRAKVTWACCIVAFSLSFVSNLSVVGISLVRFFLYTVSRSDLQLDFACSFMPIYWGYARNGVESSMVSEALDMF
ncbi:hypothetical protein HDV64DRAFT_249496 [Trichoderma sp. TUCIM 5745]